MARGEMPFEHLLLLTAHQADEVIFAHRAAHQNSRLRPCRYGLRWIADLSQAACHRSDDDFELCATWWEETYAETTFEVSFRR
jgi:hypothetical protein